MKRLIALLVVRSAAIICALILPQVVFSSVLLSDGFSEMDLDTTVWTVAVPGVSYSVGAGALQVTDVSELAPIWSGWHQGFVTAALPIGNDDFRIDIWFDYQPIAYQWLRMELLRADDWVAASIGRVNSPSPWVESHVDNYEVSVNQHGGVGNGPMKLTISRTAGDLKFYWNDSLEGSATNNESIERVRLNFARYATTEFGSVAVDSVFCELPCEPDSLSDPDGDGTASVCDNCPLAYNPTQDDLDGDAIGDACDNCPGMVTPDQRDSDGDGRGDLCDNCPADFNPSQTDTDGDGLGDICDACLYDPLNDTDGDGICGDIDNCPSVAKSNQADSDGDGFGNVCDNCPTRPNPLQEETDGDGVADSCDNCPTVYNVSQTDVDGDGIGNSCDLCLTDPLNDPDADTVCNSGDNCPEEFNPDQADTNGNGIGDVCDCACDCHGDPAPEGSCDGFVDIVDVTEVINVAFRGQAAIPDPNGYCPYETTDVNCTGSTDIVDVGKVINVAFRGSNAAAEFCEPCGP